ncbi:hypothetical protein M758_2G085400 [Ceratodon purpureus]|nr:hypothetical protein M758_2G085400 [Ceratodon purpureus]
MPSSEAVDRDRLWEFESRVDGGGGGERRKVVLGVDGGGTCTACVCVAAPLPASRGDELPFLSRVETGCSNYNSVGVEAARRAIEESMAGALKKAQVPRSAVLSVCLAAAGVDRQSDIDSYRMWIRKIFPEDVEIFVQNDAVAALASGSAGKLYGCVLVSGTGTIALGFNEDGKFARASGGGPLLGDQGSGYSIASQALAAVMRAEDGRGPKTSLTGAILKKLNLSTSEDLIGWVYEDTSWARVSALVPVVKACAQDNDIVAIELLEGAVSELANSVQAVVRTLNLHGRDGRKAFPFVMVGGVLDYENGWDIRKPLIKKVLELFPGAQPTVPKLEPALGSAMLAWSRYSDRLTKDA